MFDAEKEEVKKMVPPTETIIANQTVRLLIDDWDAIAKDEIQTGKGFRITEKGKTDTTHEAGYYSIHSPLYGSDFGDDSTPEYRWSCKCRNYVGKNYRGIVCPKCKTKVEYIGIDITKTGWIILDHDTIIQSEMYKKIRSFIGPKSFGQIIKYKNPIERDPNVNPFDGIGLIKFKERFSEIMDYYLKKKPAKLDKYLFIMSQIDLIWVHSIPVFSSKLRPFIIQAEDIKYSPEDTLFRKIFSNHELLNSRYELSRRLDKVEQRNNENSLNRLRRENILYSIQTDLDKLWDYSFDNIKRKTGVIRSFVLGGRLNYTARNVIIPSPTLRANEIEIGYITFLTLYKLEIISLLETMYNIPHSEVWGMYDKALINFDERVYNIMKYMVENRNVCIEINRNPTIDYGSMLVMKVVHVSPDIRDHTMALPESILKVMNADFDGDTLNEFSQKLDAVVGEYQKKLDPVRNLFVSRNDGKYNRKTGLYKDQTVELYAFLNI